MESARLRYRPLALSDGAAVYELASREEVARFMRFDRLTSLDEARELTAAYIAQGEVFAVERKDGGGFIGLFAFQADREQAGVYSLSTFLRREVWNRGYGGEILARMLAYAAQHPLMRRLTAYVVGDNLASRRVLEANGFRVARTLCFDDLPSELLVYERETAAE